MTETLVDVDLASFVLHGDRVLVVTFHRGPTSLEDIAAFGRALGTCYARRGPRGRFDMVYDTRKVGGLGPRYLKALSDVNRGHEAATRQYVRRIGIVVGSTVVKVFLKALFALRKPAVTTQSFKTARECMAWINGP